MNPGGSTWRDHRERLRGYQDGREKPKPKLKKRRKTDPLSEAMTALAKASGQAGAAAKDFSHAMSKLTGKLGKPGTIGNIVSAGDKLYVTDEAGDQVFEVDRKTGSWKHVGSLKDG